MKWTAMLVIVIGGIAVLVGWRGSHNGIWTAITGKPAPAATPPVYNPLSFFSTPLQGNVAGPLPDPNTVAAPVVAGANAILYEPLAIADAKAAGIDTNFFVRQIQAESNFDPNAVSPAGAIGIAQFMPSTAAGLGVDPKDPAASLVAAANLMKNYIMNNFSGTGTVNTDTAWDKALTIYNGGQGELNMAEGKATLFGGSFLNYLNSDTRQYIKNITGD